MPLSTRQSLAVLGFPAAVWAMEAVQGYTLAVLFGRNVAWFYDGPDARLHGNIKLRHLPAWLALGAVLQLALGAVLRLGAALAPVSWELVGVAAAVTWARPDLRTN